MFHRLLTALRGLTIAALVGVLGGVVSAAFIGSLNWATTLRSDYDWLIWTMPLGGLLVGLAYHYLGHSVVAGNNLVLDEIHEPGAGVPTRMAPMVYGGSVVSHVVGASVGREGAAVQITASIADSIGRIFRPSENMRRLLLVSAVAAGFGGMFNVPIAGAIFALEVQYRSKVKLDHALNALLASMIGVAVVRGLNIQHFETPDLADIHINFSLLWRLVAAAALFAAVAVSFIKLVHGLKEKFAEWIAWGPLRPVAGALAVLALTALAGTRDYLGLSTGIAETALIGAAGLSAAAFLWKLVFTSVSLGSGFVGGEVLPIFIVGALVGAQTGRVLDASIPLFAALGFIGVFAAAANTPIACLVIGLELFGTGAVLPMAIVCGLAYAFSGSSSIYTSQRK